MIDDRRYQTASVRANLLTKVAAHLQNRRSVKLIGIPQIGITTFLRTFQADERFKRDFFVIYLGGRYDPEGFQREVNEHLARHGIEAPRLEPNYLTGFLMSVRDRLAPELASRQLVWVFDQFHQNFSSLKDKQDSILSVKNLTSLRQFAETDAGMQFIVTYRHPIDLILNEDWYLTNFETEDVELLSEKKARELLTIARSMLGSPADEGKISDLLAAGGRYPPLLDLAARCPDPVRDADFQTRARKIYIHLETYLKQADKDLQTTESTIAVLAEIAKSPVGAKHLEHSRYNLARHYCYRVVAPGGETEHKVLRIWFFMLSLLGVVAPDGETEHKVLSEGFGEHLIMSSADAVTSTKRRKFALQLVSVCGVTLGLCLLVPFIYTVCLVGFEPFADRLLVIPEYDFLVLRPQYLVNLWSYYHMASLLAGPFVMAVVWLTDKVLFKQQGTSMSWPVFKDKSFLEKLEALFLWIPAFFLTFSLVTAGMGFWTAANIDWISVQRSEEAITATLQSCRTAENAIGGAGYNDVLRRVYLNQTFISREIHPNAYILITPLALILPKNFASAVQANSAYAAGCWRTQVVSGIDSPRELERRLKTTLAASHSREALDEHASVWRRDHENGTFSQVLTEAGKRLPEMDLGTPFEELERKSPDVAHLLYSSIRAGMLARNGDGTSPLLDVVTSVLRRVLAEGVVAPPLPDRVDAAHQAHKGRSRR